MCRREINDPLRECGHVSATQRPPAPFVINKRLKIKGKMPNGVSCELPAVLWALAMMRRGSSPGVRAVGSRSRKDRQEELLNAKNVLVKTWATTWFWPTIDPAICSNRGNSRSIRRALKTCRWTTRKNRAAKVSHNPRAKWRAQGREGKKAKSWERRKKVLLNVFCF